MCARSGNLFEVDRSVITEHIANIFKDGELLDMDKAKTPRNAAKLEQIPNVGPPIANDLRANR